jgi:hypothetical protein
MNHTPRAVLIEREKAKLESLEPLLRIEDALNELCNKLAPEMCAADGKITCAASKAEMRHRNILQRLQMEEEAAAQNQWKACWAAAEELAESNPRGALEEFRRLAKSRPAGMRLSGEVVRGAILARKLMDTMKRPGEEE